MTQQNIFYGQSTEIIRNAFISHIKKTILDENYQNSEFKLEDLHKLSAENEKLLKKGTDQGTLFHKAIYSTFDEPDHFFSDFWFSYRNLCLEIVEILKKNTGFFEEWAIQRYPTFRFHFPNNISVFEFHRDSNYSHPIGEINCFYAINECINSSALQIEKNLGFEDYFPLNLTAGQYALLNTSIYKHGDILNKTNKTRISMDFRFIPKAFLKNQKSSLTKNIKFNTNSYFIGENDMKNLRK